MNGTNLTRLMELEHQGWDALCRSVGGDFYGRLMMPEAVMILVNGMILDRETIASTLNDSPPWTSYELSQESLVPINDDAAAVVYRASAVRQGDDQPFIALMTSVYRMVEGEARLVLYQQTAITH
ncbi:DUF4440 domain-containing protein [Nostocoides sp. F2B08]|uniref:DUF4440 domain-containing protein n=1 Tax=Nostocoides sp. F2B08 TaxID=2653936 RepID=UPI001263162F|nr:nuclear transport factor 2 family protein [Tetrasphaera sp. F2B08]KAB7745126.1 DUF4440 domain-containing protein [Tetrasphaera sp. F2B08]